MGQGSSGHNDMRSPFEGLDMLPFTLNVLEYCDWGTRVAALSTSKQFADIGRLEITYRWYCERLALQHGVYSSYEMGEVMGWQQLFNELYPLRHMWEPKTELNAYDLNQKKVDRSPNPISDQSFKVNVFVRFRPQEESVVASTDLKNVTLPLHQRMALIRMSHGISSKKEILQVLMKEGSWFGPKWEAYRKMKGKGRHSPPKGPLSGQPNETAQTLHAGVHNLDPEFNRLVMVTPDVGMREFSFDGVFPTDVNQRHVYNKVTRKLVMDSLNGFNTTVVVYGQTGSGKTYTMFGPSGLTSPGVGGTRETSDNRGLVYRACSELLFAVFHRKQLGIETEIGVSYVEIFGDTVTDLLRNGARCGQSKVSAQRYVLTGAVQQTVHTLSEIMHFLRIGEDQKRRAATMMNEVGDCMIYTIDNSLAHCLLIVHTLNRDLVELTQF